MAFRLRSRRFAALVVILVAGLLAGAGWWWVTRWRPPERQFPVQGVAVDEATGAIDWPMMAATPADFAYIRATVGARARDPRFAENWQGALQAGMRRGIVHDYSLCQAATEQARNLVTHVARDPEALPAVVSVSFDESCPARPDRERLARDLGRFIAMVETHTGKPMLLRTTPDVEGEYRLSGLIARPVWSVRRFLPPDYASKPWRLWEATDLRRVEAAEHPVRWLVAA